MNSLDALARAGRAKLSAPELRYHGGPLNRQTNTWPEAIPLSISMQSGDQREGTYVLMSGGADPINHYYQWLPSA
ncbi:hypothetical protein [Streptomyces venezuelae]|uniref:hypothetical protein n=1 Tax=Streptomyces venezuelae TaxID=54571 RepID=UPI0034361CF9